MLKHPPQFFLSLYGWTFWVPILVTGGAGVVVGLVLPGGCWISVGFGVVTLACLAFYRDFPRAVPSEAGVMVAPADGRVAEITRVEHYGPLGGPALKVGIFLSVLDVHVNRSPCAGVVLWTRYEEGLFLDARHVDCSAKNQSNTITLAAPPTTDHGPLTTDHSPPIAVVKQIVGAIARRIIAPVTVGEKLERGQRFGMIAFGSRTELYVPAGDGWRVVVALGGHVKAGKDVVLRKS